MPQTFYPILEDDSKKKYFLMRYKWELIVIRIIKLKIENKDLFTRPM